MGNDVPAILVEGLVKRYGRLTAVDGVSFLVHPGEVYALLGPNGAGKTTTVEVLAGYRRPTAGRLRVLGLDPHGDARALRQRVGIVLQSGGFDEELTVAETVGLYAGLYPRPRDPDSVLDTVGLREKAGARVHTLSGGQRRRLDLALALVGNPDLLYLDEPTTGFDPAARRRAWEVLLGLRATGVTVLLTSHYMDEVQRLADRVGVLSAGRIIAESTPAELGRRADAEASVRLSCPDEAWADRLPPGPWLVAGWRAGVLELRTSAPTEALHVLTRWALDRGEELPGLSVTRPSLEDVYLALTEPSEPEPAP